MASDQEGVRLLVCTKDKKYSSLRKKLVSDAKESETAVVASISVAIAANFGIAAGLCAPFIALCLIALIRLGREVFCSSNIGDVQGFFPFG